MPEIESIKWLRVNAGLTQQQAAAAIGVSRETFNRWETGRIEIPPLKLARFQKVLASNAAFAPPVPVVATPDPSKAALRAEYDRWQKRYDSDGDMTNDEIGSWADARDAWYMAEHGAKWLITLYEDEAVADMAKYKGPRERVVSAPTNWVKDHAHHTETPAYKAFVKAYGLDLL